MLKSSNDVVQNAIASNGDMVGAGAWLAGFELSKKLRKENEERKARAKGNVSHAVRDLNSAMSLFDMAAKNGDPIASAASQSISQSLGFLSRLLTS